jgi:hypothetical protein
MNDDARHAEFTVTINDNDTIRIETDDCYIVTEYFADQDASRSTMGPANIFFSAFAL